VTKALSSITAPTPVAGGLLKRILSKMDLFYRFVCFVVGPAALAVHFSSWALGIASFCFATSFVRAISDLTQAVIKFNNNFVKAKRTGR
jgi:hypothetical protein